MSKHMRGGWACGSAAVLGLIAMSAIPASAGWTFNLVHSFTGGSDGGNPWSALAIDGNGNIHGTTFAGGNGGTAFEVSPGGAFSTIFTFSGTNGYGPTGSLALDASGDLYGATISGGTSGYGTVFELTAGGTETVLHSFSKSEGYNPYGGVVADGAGNLFGSTSTGGAYQQGAVFEVTPDGTESQLASLGVDYYDALSPQVGLAVDSAGNLYGTTEQGGGWGYGAIYKITPSGAESVIYSFNNGKKGAYPSAALIIGANGKLYGTTAAGGKQNLGEVFEVDTNGRHIKVLYSFKGRSDGTNPEGQLYSDSAGNLFGTTVYGGNTGCNGNGCGTVFEISRGGKETVLHVFSGTDGAYPFNTLVEDAAGNLWGTTIGGGPNINCPNAGGGACGVLFELSPQH